MGFIRWLKIAPIVGLCLIILSQFLLFHLSRNFPGVLLSCLNMKSIWSSIILPILASYRIGGPAARGPPSSTRFLLLLRLVKRDWDQAPR